MASGEKALVLGVSGQDGAYLSAFLAERGYAVTGTSRDPYARRFERLEALGVAERVALRTLDPSDYRSVLEVFADVRPDEIYHLAGQSSPGLSFELPNETFESVTVGTLNCLEAIRFLKLDCRFYHAASSEIFGAAETPANESTPFRPGSPYAVAKAAATWHVRLYREAYGLWACSGILFNHESPLRPGRFVTAKIAQGVAAIVRGEAKGLTLGNLDIVRDWGWAPEYVEAMWRMLRQDEPEDFVIATGQPCSLRAFLKAAFEAGALDWERFVRVDPSLFRPNDPARIVGDPARARERLGWRARFASEDVAREMTRAALGAEENSAP